MIYQVVVNGQAAFGPTPDFMQASAQVFGIVADFIFAEVFDGKPSPTVEIVETL